MRKESGLINHNCVLASLVVYFFNKSVYRYLSSYVNRYLVSQISVFHSPLLDIRIGLEKEAFSCYATLAKPGGIRFVSFSFSLQYCSLQSVFLKFVCVCNLAPLVSSSNTLGMNNWALTHC